VYSFADLKEQSLNKTLAWPTFSQNHKHFFKQVRLSFGSILLNKINLNANVHKSA
jgi:hypothetical protein